MPIIVLFLITVPLYAYDLYQKGDDNGHNLLIIGGIHGNEPGGFFTASTLIQHYTFKHGRVYIIPNMNAQSIQKNQRGIHGDMNRKFDTISNNDPDFNDVTALKKFILSHSIDLVLNLHDGHGYYRDDFASYLYNSSAWGQTCVIDEKKLDHNCTFSELEEIAKQVEQAINSNLLESHHQFNTKNTHTASRDKQMQQSLTYFCIKHGVPAFAIETSKDLNRLEEKLYYQLQAIETFLKIMNISYETSKKRTIKNLSSIIKNYGKLTINRNISLSLSNIRKTLSFVPLKSTHNDFNFTHPLGSVRKIRNSYAVYIGNRRISTLRPEVFDTVHCNNTVAIHVDKTEKVVNIPSSFSVLSDFNVMQQENVRVNVIGFHQADIQNESGITIAKNQLSPRFSIDRSGQQYRVEFYHNATFCGMLTAKFLGE